MQETPQQYTARMLSLIGDKDPLKIQQATAKKLAAAIKGLDKKAYYNAYYRYIC